jgi:predicted tellurium resistance membrane protein TerC
MQLVEFLGPYFAFIHDPTAWAALLTLVVLEIVLGIDNLIFISILTNKLPEAQRVPARRLGISAALVMRLILLATISIIVQLTNPVFTAFGHGFSWRDMILIAGGLFLVWKATREIHHTVDPADHEDASVARTLQLSLAGAIFQILLLDLVFSIDSIITAVGMTDDIAIMYIAVAEGLHLRRHGLLRAGGGAQHAGAEPQGKAGRPLKGPSGAALARLPCPTRLDEPGRFIYKPGEFRKFP